MCTRTKQKPQKKTKKTNPKLCETNCQTATQIHAWANSLTSWRPSEAYNSKRKDRILLEKKQQSTDKKACCCDSWALLHIRAAHMGAPAIAPTILSLLGFSPFDSALVFFCSLTRPFYLFTCWIHWLYLLISCHLAIFSLVISIVKLTGTSIQGSLLPLSSRWFAFIAVNLSKE